jgi:hypothetical protein
MTTELKTALVLAVVMLLVAIIVSVWSARLHKGWSAAAPTSQLSPSVGCFAAFGVFVLCWFLITLVVAAPLMGILPAAAFLLVGESMTRRGSDALARPTALLMLLCGLMWLVYAWYEAQFSAWMKTVRAPIRIDLIIVGPPLYLVTLLGLNFGRYAMQSGRLHAPGQTRESIPNDRVTCDVCRQRFPSHFYLRADAGRYLCERCLTTAGHDAAPKAGSEDPPLQV